MRTDPANNAVARALWFIESHLADEIGLDDVAAAAGLSRFHLARVFALASGRSVLRYVRARRLSAAAHALAGGAPDILAVALSHGYGSHEAFTRAFRDELGSTPGDVRDRRSIHGLPLLEASNVMDSIVMEESRHLDLPAPRVVDRGAIHVAGLREACERAGSPSIPAQWRRVAADLEGLPGRIGTDTFGVVCPGDDGTSVDYLAGVELREDAPLPGGWSRLWIPPRRYAVFAHRGHVAEIQRTWLAIWSHGLVDAGLEAAGGPELERYGSGFDPATGRGGCEIWVPVR